MLWPQSVCVLYSCVPTFRLEQDPLSQDVSSSHASTGSALPTAVWLFGGGLAGLVGVLRRRQVAV